MMITSKNLAIVCPTKDRPEKIAKLLAAVANNTSLPHQFIIANVGADIEDVVQDFKNTLNVKILNCPEPGQILQRHYAHQHLDPSISIVLHLDDDVILASDALQKAIDHWNDASKDPTPIAGIALNITNYKDKKNNLFRYIAIMRVEPKGQVWPSGFASPHTPVDQNITSNWLFGGATLWSRAVLQRHPHPLLFPTKWAFAEDLIYSYPLSKSYRMLICAQAKGIHNDSYVDHPFGKRKFYGFTKVIMLYYFVSENKDLSMLAFSWMTLIQFLAFFALALLGSKAHAGLALGTAQGAIAVMKSIFAQSTHLELVKRLASDQAR